MEIDEEIYDKLVKADVMLQCLQSYGVDNWSGYDDACNEYEEWNRRYNLQKENEDIIEKYADDIIQEIISNIEVSPLEDNKYSCEYDCEENIKDMLRNLINEIKIK